MIVRLSAVAGKFYSSSADELRDDILQCLADAGCDLDAEGAPDIASGDAASNIIIAPHAGYVFSAPVAAAAFARVPRNIKRAFVIGPSHHKMFNGLHVSDANFYATPLGNVKTDDEIIRRLRESDLCKTYDGVEEKEHCLEVQIPFLQVLFKNNFTIVPLLAGRVDTNAAAKLLLPFAGDETLFIASSDLSHYLPQDRAREIDDATIRTIVSGDADGFMEGCGETAMRIVMKMAAALNLRAEVLDARTSHETAPQHCSEKNVVGYAAVVFVKQAQPESSCSDGSCSDNSRDEFSDDEKSALLKLARDTLVNAVNNNVSDDDDAVNNNVDDDVNDNIVSNKSSASSAVINNIMSNKKLAQKLGCFVTLNKHGRLRGCIGNIEPIRPLYKSVVDNAINAAFHDPRFDAVTANELDEIDIEISILTRPRPLKYDSPDDLLAKLIPRKHGVILKFGAMRQSTFLPQVWEQLPNKIIFLEHLSMKAGMDKNAWQRGGECEVWIYEAIHFCE